MAIANLPQITEIINQHARLYGDCGFTVATYGFDWTPGMEAEVAAVVAECALATPSLAAAVPWFAGIMPVDS